MLHASTNGLLTCAIAHHSSLQTKRIISKDGQDSIGIGIESSIQKQGTL